MLYAITLKSVCLRICCVGEDAPSPTHTQSSGGYIGGNRTLFFWSFLAGLWRIHTRKDMFLYVDKEQGKLKWPLDAMAMAPSEYNSSLSEICPLPAALIDPLATPCPLYCCCWMAFFCFDLPIAWLDFCMILIRNVDKRILKKQTGKASDKILTLPPLYVIVFSPFFLVFLSYTCCPSIPSPCLFSSISPLKSCSGSQSFPSLPSLTSISPLKFSSPQAGVSSNTLKTTWPPAPRPASAEAYYVM